MSNSQKTNNSQETVTISKEDAQKVEGLQKQLEAKNKEIETIKQKTTEAIIKIKQEARSEADIKTDLTKKIIKQNTFKHNYRDGYADGTVKEAKKKILAERKKAKAGTR